MKNLKALGERMGIGLRYFRFLNEKDFIALVYLWSCMFEEFTPDTQRQYERGYVLIDEGEKYVVLNDNMRFMQDQSPKTHTGCLLVRDELRDLDWIAKEFCIKDSKRFYIDNNNAQNTGWYIVVKDTAGDNNTPPPNAPQYWERMLNYVSSR